MKKWFFSVVLAVPCEVVDMLVTELFHKLRLFDGADEKIIVDIGCFRLFRLFFRSYTSCNTFSGMTFGLSDNTSVVLHLRIYRSSTSKARAAALFMGAAVA
ncbi:hypothetical protein NPIL_657861 [Nephila pilipes]|uniref:Secreted protein n=1 Tax=Nephila pilipes TaxID=299642 RepID=A0A8X6MDS5_NEPPI|nr:hypothetical protein NPIL_657861 [Nephila pilipes]